MPINPEEISWYVCGPTVYDHSHMGHARNYVQWDIIRRIMADYFGYNIKVDATLLFSNYDSSCLALHEHHGSR